MKRLFILLTFILSLSALAEVKPKYPQCGYDYNCFYEEEAKAEQREKGSQNEYRSEQLQMQERQLEEVEEQNGILDQQLELQQEEAEASIQDDPNFEAPVE